MSFDYERLLERARGKLPKEIVKSERFEIPKMRFTVVGNRTIIHNFREIADILNRNPQHLLKYLSGEMATAATLDGERAIFQGKFTQETLERLVKLYAEYFVICPVCRRPDTKIVKERRLSFIICEACGARSPVKSV
jgi:translation initiation factor 2 subunit 2